MATYSFKSIGTVASDPDLIKGNTQARPFGIKTPLEEGSGRSGIFMMHFDAPAQISDNLKNLILTNNGERLGNFTYGANLRELTAEIIAKEDFDTEAMLRIKDAVRSHMSYVELDTFTTVFTTATDTTISNETIAKVDMTIKYNVPTLRIVGKALEISLVCIG
jgi:phage baseplate assembly protein W